jgi:hypothetical protein
MSIAKINLHETLNPEGVACLNKISPHESMNPIGVTQYSPLPGFAQDYPSCHPFRVFISPAQSPSINISPLRGFYGFEMIFVA